MDNLPPKEISDEEMINQAFHELPELFHRTSVLYSHPSMPGCTSACRSYTAGRGCQQRGPEKVRPRPSQDELADRSDANLVDTGAHSRRRYKRQSGHKQRICIHTRKGRPSHGGIQI